MSLILGVGVVLQGTEPDVVINELMYNPAVEPADEWVELYNSGSTNLDISGWVIRDRAGNSYSFPDAAVLSPHSFAVIHSGKGVNSEADYYWNRGNAVWNNTGDEVWIVAEGGVIVDYIRYDATAGRPWPIEDTQEDSALALLPNGDDLDSSRNWVPRSGPFVSPGTNNPLQPSPAISLNFHYSSFEEMFIPAQTGALSITVDNKDRVASIKEFSCQLNLPSSFSVKECAGGKDCRITDHIVRWGKTTIPPDSSLDYTVTFVPRCSDKIGYLATMSSNWSPYRAGPVYSGNSVSRKVALSCQDNILILSPDHVGEGTPSTRVTYSHRLTNYRAQVVPIVLEYRSTPGDIHWTVYQNNLPEEPLPSGSSISLQPGQTQKLIVAASIPSDTAPGTEEVVELSAKTASNVTSVTDITIIGTSEVTLTKEIKTVNSSWSKVVQLASGDQVSCRLRFQNVGVNKVANIAILDKIPDFSRYMSGSASDNDGKYEVFFSTDEGLTWSSYEPSLPGSITHLKWKLPTTVLDPGDKGYVTYSYIIE